jgi:Bacterial Ig-like domain/Right handed beta helix region
MREQSLFRGKGRWQVPGGGTLAAVALMTMVACGYGRPEDVPGVGDASPEVVLAEPAPYSAAVEPGAAIRIRFSKPVDPTTAAVTLEAAGLPVDGTIEVDGDMVEFRPTISLAKGMPFTVTVTHIADLANNANPTPYAYDFTTVTNACVRPGGAGGCFALVSTAVVAATAGDSIAVAAGTYLDNVIVDKTVHLLGGYNDILSVRDPKTYLTTIRGRTSELSLIEISTLNADQPNATIVDGFTLTGHTRNDHGAGLRANASNPRIRNNVISGNKGTYLGGGVYIAGGAAHLAKNRIEDNTLLDEGTGAGVAIENATVEMVDNLIVNNRIPATNGDGYGGGIGISFGTVLLRNIRIEGNRAAGIKIGHGSGVSILGAKVSILGGSISRNDVDIPLGRATADAGAGVYINSTSDVRMEGVTLRDNVGSMAAAAGASGIHAEASTLVVASSIVANNRNGSAGISVGPLGSYVIFNCTIAGNTGKGVVSRAYFTIVNSVIMQEPIGVEAVGTSAANGKLDNNVFYATTTNTVGVNPGTSNVTMNPGLNADLRLIGDSLLIDVGRSGSILDPALGAAVTPPQIDIDGESRSIAGRAGNAALPDIGADEYQP